MSTPETHEAPVPKTPDSVLVKEVPETPEATPELQETGVTSVPSQFTQVIQDDSGKPMTSSPATKTVTVTIPATQEQLSEWAKGPDENALTWLARFWLRMIRKALSFGWNIVTAPFGGTDK